MKKGLKLGGLLATAMVAERMITKKEQQEIKEYGTKIVTSHGNMNTAIFGTGETTIVLLSGYGSTAPILDFTPLAHCLANDFQVVILEYLGYGCSDDTETERSVEQICEEIHDVMKELHISSYWLMPHSISGIYALAYANRYVDEVAGVLCIDTSCPKQNEYANASLDVIVSTVMNKSGFTRLLSKVAPNKVLPPKAIYGEDMVEQIRLRMLQHTTSQAIKDEGKRIKENLSKCHDMRFPDIPVLMFISDSNIKMTKGWWKTLHEEQLEGLNHKTLIILHGSHYLHWTNSETMAKDVKAFITSIDTANKADTIE